MEDSLSPGDDAYTKKRSANLVLNPTKYEEKERRAAGHEICQYVSDRDEG